MEGCGRNFHPNNLIFSWVCWATVIENKNDYIFGDNIEISSSYICFYTLSSKITLTP